MANGHGGSRTPSNPAPVSGPGKLSRRTDGGPQQTAAQMTGMPYGENADLTNVERSAPLAASPTASNARSRNTVPAGQGAASTPLFSPTQRPDEPVTAGAPFGPGDSPQQSKTLASMSKEEAQNLVTVLPALEAAANSDYGTESFRRFVQYVKAVVQK